jgi:glucan phosphoethanolaminetransferase (alkaline phosphatase superfamily)
MISRTLDVPASTRKQALWLTIAALIAYVVMNHLMVGNVADEFFSRGVPKSLVYVLWIGCGFAVFYAVLLTAGRIGLVIVLSIACVSVSTNYSYAVIVKQHITPTLMEWMAQEFGQLSHAWGEYRFDIALSVAKAVALLAIFVAIRAAIRRRRLLPDVLLRSRRVRYSAMAAFLVFHGAALLLQPSYTVAETNLFVFGIPASMTEAPQRRAVPVRAEREGRAEKILFVIDESVGRHVYASTLAPMLQKWPVVDFGEAASIVPCSAASNALLRWGIETSRLAEAGYDPRTNPTIWAFANAAGYRTTLIDGQSKGAMQNFLSSGELAMIDEFITADVGIESDARIAAMLVERLKRPGRELIYVVKRGSHFPYEMNYPAGTLPADASKREKYAASVAYSTGAFFRELMARVALSNLLLIYTSDHGQNLASKAVHCSDQRHPDEFSVPLAVMSEVPALKALLVPALPRMHDRASHLNVFPTLLYGMGYAKEWIEATYGPTLAGPATPYVTVGWVPYPPRRQKSMDITITPEFPGRANAGHAAAPAGLTVQR